EEEDRCERIEERCANFVSSLLYGFFVRRHGAYSIYRIAKQYYGVLTARVAFLEKELEYVQMEAKPPILFIDSDVASLMKKIDAHEEAMTPEARRNFECEDAQLAQEELLDHYAQELEKAHHYMNQVVESFALALDSNRGLLYKTARTIYR